MVSLAEKRTKIRYTVNQKTEWTDDSSKFGQRMLEKMGWKQGVGLGKDESGRVEHISLAFKDNLKGVGYMSNKYDDTWVHHQDGFDNVLQQLQQQYSTATTTFLSTKCNNTSNLVEKLEATKTRFRYKKQSGGKDLSTRSSSDLDCIFGWNKMKQIKQNDETTATTIVDDENKNYVTSKQSIQDYFKEKSKQVLLAKQQKQQQQSVDEKQHGDDFDKQKQNDEGEIIDIEIKQKRKKHKKYHNDEPDQAMQSIENELNYIQDEKQENKKKHKTNESMMEESTEDIQQILETIIKDDIKMEKKKKKKKRQHSDTLEVEQLINESSSVNEIQTTVISFALNNDKELSTLFPTSNISEIHGYEGYDIDKSLNEIIQLKAKQKRHKEKLEHELTPNLNV
ncbi:unnamed protein product [Didymodactylos carnosus]|uniref:G-patch domain-containing protein n=2 Tax=Didymodactylos carnosus TaxID=1234261 RepID=A0A814KYY3_9BILA|nr:unnamed protein product [Didymodactylos carnosus]CAF3827336.1 unnamed protein product [Didymodactylos carnosus]